jgi:hypothetical protein
MADHYVAVARGVEGTKYSDFTTGTSSAATALFEFRVLDGVTPKKVEVLKALEAIERFFENAQQVTTAGFDVAG